jgi:D-alanine-D-alanine ligase
LKLANIAFVGAGVLGSAIGMDKDVMKRLLRDAGIPIARFLVVNRYSSKEIGLTTRKISLAYRFSLSLQTSARRSASIKSKIAKNSRARSTMRSIMITKS